MPNIARHFRYWGMVWLLFAAASCLQAQAALLLEQPYGLARVLSPVGHVALYFARICPESPTRLRRCRAGETGAVIARYQGIDGYDWIAVPPLPYLYAVESANAVPASADRETVHRLRRQYHDAHLTLLGANLPEGGLVRRGWDQIAGSAYSRRIFALRFHTTPEQDDRLIAWLNATPNRSRFHLLWGNCADFASQVLDLYFPGVFHRRLLPDAGITTPRQLAWELQRYARKHNAVELRVFEIPQVPGSHGRSLSCKSTVESLIMSGDVVPVAVLAPWVAVGIGADFLIWGRYPLELKGAQRMGPEEMGRLRDGGAGNPSGEAGR